MEFTIVHYTELTKKYSYEHSVMKYLSTVQKEKLYASTLIELFPKKKQYRKLKRCNFRVACMQKNHQAIYLFS